MKIALVIFNYGETRGGAERAAANLVRGLILRRHEIHVFSHLFDGADKGVQWHPVKALKVGGLFKHSSFAKNVDTMLRASSFDIVQSFTRILRCDVYRVGGGVHEEYLKRVEGNRGRISRVLAKVNPKNYATSSLEGASFAPGAYRKIVAVSRRCKREILAHYPVPEKDIWVIYNGVDTDIFNPENVRRLRAEMRRKLSLGRDEFTLLFAANGWKTKGLNYAIEALARLPSNARLLIAGKGRERPYQALIQEHSLEHRVKFLGPRADIPQLHTAADVLVHPTLHDPFPNSCLEAMASGVPVVTTSVTGVAEIMTDGKDGCVIDDGSNVDALADRLTGLLDPERRQAMGAAARSTAEQYTISRYTQSYLAVYDEILRSRSGAKSSF